MTMKVIDTIEAMRKLVLLQKKKGKRVGLVPTMGYLHDGHLSLVREAKKHCDFLVVSIYVNPTQFAPGEDLDQYPRDFRRDNDLCLQEGVDVIFFPANEEMYSPEHKTYVVTEELSGLLCGSSRPTHFRGVTTVVTKLFHIVQPDVAVFGQKDYQQAVIIKKMVQDLNFDVEIVLCPVVREEDGLALSSRNKYLDKKQRAQANVLYRSLLLAERVYNAGNRDGTAIIKMMEDLINSSAQAKIDYIALADADTLAEAQPGKRDSVMAVAVYFGKTRLIDNIILKRKPDTE